MASSVDILTALLDRGADPTMLTDRGSNALMWQAIRQNIDVVTCLLQDPCVRCTVNVQDVDSNTTPHHACMGFESEHITAPISYLLLQAGADPTVTNKEGLAPVAFFRQQRRFRDATTTLLEQALADAERTWLIVKARRLIITATNTRVPSYLQHRVVRGHALPHVTQASVTGSKRKIRKRRREFHSMLAFLLGLGGGPKGEGMPRDVFRVVMDMLMPAWDPLRRKIVSSGP